MQFLKGKSCQLTTKLQNFPLRGWVVEGNLGGRAPYWLKSGGRAPLAQILGGQPPPPTLYRGQVQTLYPALYYNTLTLSLFALGFHESVID